MVEQAYTLTVRKGCYEEYKKSHDELWPEVAALLDECSISMIIHYNEPTLCLYQVAPSQESFDRYNRADVTRRWNEYMATLLETDEQGRIIKGNVEEAFVCGIFKEKNLLRSL